ncbi:response regulator [Paragemmobacter aquarius]|uniref:response regulator n=1 Tax=Paragemmobacter aquarius TaxID=2169400 RepID=UPI00131F14F3|nr:response regulator [Gemmobacter aquarius]
MLDDSALVSQGNFIPARSETQGTDAHGQRFPDILSPKERILPPARILIVEDEFLIALTTEAELVDAGFIVVGKAANYEKALEIARTTRPDLALMDVRLGAGRDGIEAAIALRAELDLPAIIATGSMDDENRRRAIPAAPLAWLPKPYTGEELVVTVTQALDALHPVVLDPL